MKIAIGCDNLALDMKNMIIEVFSKKGYQFEDMGTYDKEPVAYPDFAFKVADAVAKGQYERGILVCGTGIGMALAANKVNGAYAAVCHDLYSTQRSILSNNANIMCMGSLVIGPKTAEAMVDVWLNLQFDPKSASAKKVDKIYGIEKDSFGVK